MARNCAIEGVASTLRGAASAGACIARSYRAPATGAMRRCRAGESSVQVAKLALQVVVGVGHLGLQGGQTLLQLAESEAQRGECIRRLDGDVAPEFLFLARRLHL